MPAAKPFIVSTHDSTNSPNDRKHGGHAVTLTITFNVKVDVTRGPVEIRLSDGSIAVYESGSGTKTLTFKYIPAANANNVTIVGMYKGEIVGKNSGKPVNFHHDHHHSGIDTVCFMAGTRIATPTGFELVETLKAGDLVVTFEGRTEPVCWVGRQTTSTTFADPLRVMPVRVRAGALGESVPSRDLLVSSDHALLVDGALVQAGALVNGVSIVREDDVPETFVYYHVELGDHSLILAEGAAAETFIDNVQRLRFDNWEEHEALYPNGKAIAEMAYPRAKSFRQTPPAIRARLMDRAVALYGQATEVAA